MAVAVNTERFATATKLRSGTALVSDLDEPTGRRASALAAYIADAFGSAAAAVLHYGSHLHGGSAGHDSAYDFVVVVDENAAAFRSFSDQLRPRFSAATATLLAGVLPPNIVGVKPHEPIAGARLSAKCSVLSMRQLARACSGNSQDHFIKGRLFQPVRLAWVRDDPARMAVAAALLDARSRTFDWVRHNLPPTFDVEAYCRSLLATSYGGEIRPESSDRADQLFQAQGPMLVRMYEPLLSDLAACGILRAGERGFSQVQLPTRRERGAAVRYFRRSKVRATTRWLKHIWLYDGWLEYLHRKVERRGGVAIELTPREKQWPLLFLWPKAIRYLRSKR